MCGILFAVVIGIFILSLINAYYFILIIAATVIIVLAIISNILKTKKNGGKNDVNSPIYKESLDLELENISGKTLFGGKYVGGRDIETGIYDLIVVAGSGIIETDIPEKFREYLNCDGPCQYKNLEIGCGTHLRVDTGITIKLHNRREYVQTTNLENEFFCNYEPIEDFDGLDGWEFERFCAKVLSKNAYKNVQVTRGSGDQGVDILAERDGIKYAVQCKNYSQPVGNKAIQEIYSGMNFYKCHVGIVMTNNTFTPSAIELAKENGIVLWGRDYLIKFIDDHNTISKENGGIISEDNNFNEKLEDSKDMYDKEKGVYPSGHYIVGRDIPKGSYYLTAKKDEVGCVELYEKYSDYKEDENSIIYENFSDDFFLSLNDDGGYLIVNRADMKKVQ